MLRALHWAKVCLQQSFKSSASHIQSLKVTIDLQVSQYLRSHNGTSFKWKDYSPLVFQRLRQLFGIDNMDYLLSLTGDRWV